MSDATGSGFTAHAQIRVRLNKSGAHIAVVRFLNHVIIRHLLSSFNFIFSPYMHSFNHYAFPGSSTGLLLE